MLETIREYALERLCARGGERAARHRHATFFCHFAELCAPSFQSARIAEADREYHNIRVALQWALDSGEHEIAARIVSSMFWYWDTRGLLEEARSWLEQVLRLGAALPYPWRARVPTYASYLAYRRGYPAEAADLVAMVVDDAQASAEDRALALRVTGLATLHAEDNASVWCHFERALAFAQEHRLPVAIAAAQFNLGLLYLVQGQLAEAEALISESNVPWVQQRHPRYIGVALVTLGYIAARRGDPQRASTLLRDGLRQLILAQETTYLLYGLLACAGFATIQRRPLWAATLFGAGTHQAANVHLALVRKVMGIVHAHIEQSREQCDPQAFERALRHGQSLSLEQAVVLAQSLLEEIGDQQPLEEQWAMAG
jgi:non-specific serine/threonine protein kinase